MTFCSIVIVGFHLFAPPVVRGTRLRLAPLTTGNDAHHFVNNVRSNSSFHNLKEEQIPDHASFSDAVYLFERMFGRNDPLFPAIQKYLGVSREHA